jgi:hypothetical protein
VPINWQITWQTNNPRLDKTRPYRPAQLSFRKTGIKLRLHRIGTGVKRTAAAFSPKAVCGARAIARDRGTIMSDAEGRWLTYEELGQLIGRTPNGARMFASRRFGPAMM